MDHHCNAQNHPFIEVQHHIRFLDHMEDLLGELFAQDCCTDLAFNFSSPFIFPLEDLQKEALLKLSYSSLFQKPMNVT